MHEYVHIVPVGHEYDRVIIPLRYMHPHRVYLLYIKSEDTFKMSRGASRDMWMRTKKFVRRIREELKIDVEEVDTKVFDLLDLVRKVSQLVKKEKENGNLVYVNVSAAGKLSAIGSYIAASVHGANIYYVMAERYSSTEEEMEEHGLSICRDDPKIMLELPVLKFQMPSEDGMKIIKTLMRIYPAEINLKNLAEKSEIGEGVKSMMKVIRVLEKMEQYVEMRKVGRERRVRINDAGKFIAALCGFEQSTEHGVGSFNNRA